MFFYIRKLMMPIVDPSKSTKRFLEGPHSGMFYEWPMPYVLWVTHAETPVSYLQIYLDQNIFFF